jgi:hypothetical protein
MPLTFKTESHGEIPIGFFNIDTDMILIRNYFVFASDFCNWIEEWSKIPNSEGDFETRIQMYVIKDLDEIGHLMGAISGVVFTGFIGEVYKKFPFPQKREDFKQKPDGFKNREIVEELVINFAVIEEIAITILKKERTISIGEFVFSKEQFHDLIGYIWRGGMPKWRDDIRPDYINQMMRTIMISRHWLFKADIPEVQK